MQDLGRAEEATETLLVFIICDKNGNSSEIPLEETQDSV